MSLDGTDGPARKLSLTGAADTIDSKQGTYYIEVGAQDRHMHVPPSPHNLCSA